MSDTHDTAENQLPTRENGSFSFDNVQAHETHEAHEIPPRPGTLMRNYHKQKHGSNADEQEATVVDSTGIASVRPRLYPTIPANNSEPNDGEQRSGQAGQAEAV
ncbi:MAG TPA: hypothetical protein VKU38_05665, partial [Ktedonobacteraceae bacterium]|nr:hypothetical protein [Ktedonobacteraceae bacterium]